MKRIVAALVLAVALLVATASTALGAIKIDASRFFMDPDPAFVLGPDPDARLRALNEMVAVPPATRVETIRGLVACQTTALFSRAWASSEAPIASRSPGSNSCSA